MTQQTLILGMETSCDETSVSVIRNGQEILSNTVLSQIDSHKRFGGVVPEVASRHHVEGVTATIEEALDSANVTMHEIDAIAVTQGPGLIGALLIGINAAKALAFAYDKPYYSCSPYCWPYLCKSFRATTYISINGFNRFRWSYRVSLYERSPEF